MRAGAPYRAQVEIQDATRDDWAVVQTNAAAVHLWQSVGFEVLCTVPGASRLPDRSYTGLHVMFLSLLDQAPG